MLHLSTLLAAFENLDPMNWDVILKALNFLWKGLLAIFVVIGLIILAVKLTQYFLTKAENAKKSREQNSNDENQNNPNA